MSLTKIFEKLNLKDEKFILTHSFRCFRHGHLALSLLGPWRGRPSWQAVCGATNCLPHGSQETERGRKSQGACTSKLLPPVFVPSRLSTYSTFRAGLPPPVCCRVPITVTHYFCSFFCSSFSFLFTF